MADKNSGGAQVPLDHTQTLLVGRLRDLTDLSWTIRAQAADEIERLAKTVNELAPKAVGHADLMETLEEAAGWIKTLPIPTPGATANLAKIRAALSLAKQAQS